MRFPVCLVALAMFWASWSCQRRLEASPAFPLRVGPNGRYLVDREGTPFFVMGDTPWFLQKVPLPEVRRIMEDRQAKGFNTLFLELLDDSQIPSRDARTNAAFLTDTDLTRPVEAYWDYATEVLDEAEKRGFFVILSELWYGYGKGLWMHHINPENTRVYAKFLGRKFARYRNLMWMHAGDRNPDANLDACTRVLATELALAAPHHLHTVHNAPEFASSRFYHDATWLTVNLGYTYGASYLHIRPEFERADPVRPVILGETGYEGEPNEIERLPDARAGDLWNPYRIRRNAWWAALSGASGYCAGTRLWRWEPGWRETLQARSSREAPLLRRGLERVAWWTLVPDNAHALVTGGFGEWKQATYVTAALTADGREAVIYTPGPTVLRISHATLKGPAEAQWFDPTNGEVRPAVAEAPLDRLESRYTTPGRNAAGESDWVLIFRKS